MARNSQARIYRVRQPTGKTHVSDGDLRGMIAPQYRGFRLTCLAGEVEAIKRAVDQWWADYYLAADTPAARLAVLMEERAQRTDPKDWTG